MVVHIGDNTMTLVKRIFANGWQSITGFLTSIATLIAPAIPLALTAYCFILVDLYYGYKISRKCGKKEFESCKFWCTINKLFESTLLITLALLLDKYFFMTYEELVAVKVAAGTICFAETLSLLESLKALHPNALLSKILAKVIKSKAEKYLDVDISDIIDEQKIITDDNKYNQPTKDKSQ